MRRELPAGCGNDLTPLDSGDGVPGERQSGDLLAIAERDGSGSSGIRHH